MNYKETLDFLYNSLPMYQRQGAAAYKDSLENTLELDSYFKHPHRNYPCIHVAGTNGKGSVSHMITSVLQAAGYRTGLYTSPHLLDFRERIRINGKPIGEEDVVSFVEDHGKILSKMHPSFFEMTVAMAFDYFSDHKVDVAVIETGLGGRLDSTNIVHPELSIITNISMDHMAFLGDDLLAIAREKAGIIKEGVPLVVGRAENEVLELFKKMAKEKDAPCIHAAEKYRARYRTQLADGSIILRLARNNTDQLQRIQCDLDGSYQEENIITAMTALDELQKKGWEIKEVHEARGFHSVTASTGILGRWQTIGHNPRSICDTGHNEAGIRALVAQIGQIPRKRLHMVWGMVDDKDLDTILPLLPDDASYYFTAASVPRSLDPGTLKQKAGHFGLMGSSYPDVASAYAAAEEAAAPEDLIFTGGSTFVVADLLGIKNPL